jgi:hypothetical protein
MISRMEKLAGSVTNNFVSHFMTSMLKKGYFVFDSCLNYVYFLPQVIQLFVPSHFGVVDIDLISQFINFTLHDHWVIGLQQIQGSSTVEINGPQGRRAASFATFWTIAFSVERENIGLNCVAIAGNTKYSLFDPLLDTVWVEDVSARRRFGFGFSGLEEF